MSENNRNQSSFGVGKTLGAMALGAALGAGLWFFSSQSESNTPNRAEPSTSRSNQESSSSGSNAPKCCICIKPLVGKVVKTLVRCGHTFHETCITNLLENSTYCPKCQCKVDDADFKSTSCSVCLEPMTETYKTAFLPCCHKYHTECILAVFAGNSRACPECRVEISEDDLKLLRKLS